jgi:HEAT repeat protein
MIDVRRAAAALTVLLFVSPGIAGRGYANPTWEDSIAGFVQQRFIHSVPYVEAHQLGPRALPILIKLFEDARYKTSWANIALTISYTGEPEGFETLRSFIMDRFHGEVDLETFQALAAAQITLGPLAAHSPAALRYLIEGVNPDYWRELPWTFRTYQGAERDLAMSRWSITALSHTGTPQAGLLLEELYEKPYSERQRDIITEGLARYKEVSAKGIEKYLAEHATGMAR